MGSSETTQLGDTMPPESSVRSALPTRTMTWTRLARMVWLLLATAAVSPISQLTLTPSFGSIPSSVNHATMVLVTLTLGVTLHALWGKTNASVQFLAIWSWWMPVVQWSLVGYHGALGPIGGPALFGFLSCHTILFQSVYGLVDAIDAAGLSSAINQRWSVILKSVSVLALCGSFDALKKDQLAALLAAFESLTPIHLQMVLALMYTMLQPTWLILLALPAFIHTLLMIPHLSLDAVNTALQSHSWSLVDRKWSTTGYISVLDNFDEHYRVLRCDHSLLGGEWLLTQERETREGWTVEESIYGVFATLEAIRLIELSPSIADHKADALIIGLGIGTAPKAFVSHGINTTIVELDPVVHQFAREYFGLPGNHTAVIEDAVSWVGRNAASAIAPRYDYVIHDVFTGGAEPLALFNTAFLSDLRGLLKPNAVVAVNYAGDLSLPLTRLVLRTIVHVFDGQCKIFRDQPPVPADDQAPDFVNMVVFCRNAPGPIGFRQPTAADFLGSKSRQHYMFPKPEHELLPPTGQGLLQREDMDGWGREQIKSAQQHWQLMRKVVPDVVWDYW